MSSLNDLCSLVPSGRPRPVLLESDAYAQAVIRQGKDLPWHDVAEFILHVSQVQALLRSDGVWFDVEAFFAAELQRNPNIASSMGEKSRTGYALKTLLANEDLTASLTLLLSTLAESTKRSIVFDLPSPARWLGRAHAIAGTDRDEIDPDQADSASMYIAEWMGKFGEIPVACVVFDTRAAEGDVAIGKPEELCDYSALANVAEHFSWSVVLRSDSAVGTLATDPTLTHVDADFWHSIGTVPDGDGALISDIPPNAKPETVLARLALFD